MQGGRRRTLVVVPAMVAGWWLVCVCIVLCIVCVRQKGNAHLGKSKAVAIGSGALDDTPGLDGCVSVTQKGKGV